LKVGRGAKALLALGSLIPIAIIFCLIVEIYTSCITHSSQLLFEEFALDEYYSG
jgi:hypothetical protein